MSIYEAEALNEEIRNNTHYQKCFYESEYYDSFQEQNTILQRIRNCHDDMINYHYTLIELKYYNQLKEKELEKESNLLDLKLGYIKEEYEYRLKLEKEQGDAINNNKKKFEIIQLENNCELEKLNQEISNLKKEIAELDSQKQEEIALMKKKILLELNNEYKIKLLKYRNMKELEKEREEKNFEIKKKVFEAEKEIKFNEMKNKAELVQKIIAICKNISLK